MADQRLPARVKASMTCCGVPGAGLKVKSSARAAGVETASSVERPTAVTAALRVRLDGMNPPREQVRTEPARRSCTWARLCVLRRAWRMSSGSHSIAGGRQNADRHRRLQASSPKPNPGEIQQAGDHLFRE